MNSRERGWHSSLIWTKPFVTKINVEGCLNKAIKDQTDIEIITTYENEIIISYAQKIRPSIVT